MYQVDLKEAYFPAQPGPALRDITVGEGLREAAASHGSARALTEVTVDGAHLARVVRERVVVQLHCRPFQG